MRRFLLTRRAGGAALWPATALAILLLGTKPSASADVGVFTSGAPAEVEKVLAATFTATTGHRVLFTAGTVKEIHDKLAGLEQPDIVILPAAALDVLDHAAGLRPGTRIDLARVGIGVVVRAGAPLPDISTADALRDTLLAARSIAHPDPLGGGFAGVQISRMFAHLGIADAVKPKVKLAYAFTGGVSQIANGDAEIGLFNISEILPVKGVTLVGPLAPELQSYITFSAAVHAHTASPEPAMSFLQWLSDRKASDAWRTGGFELLGGER